MTMLHFMSFDYSDRGYKFVQLTSGLVTLLRWTKYLLYL